MGRSEFRIINNNKLQGWWRHTPDWVFFFFLSFATFFCFFFSLTGLSSLSESETHKDTTSVFFFLFCGSSSLLSSSAFLFLLTSCCVVGTVCSGWHCFFSVKLCFSFAFCCSLASNSWERDSFETLPSSSSPRYLWAVWQGFIHITSYAYVGISHKLRLVLNWFYSVLMLHNFPNWEILTCVLLQTHSDDSDNVLVLKCQKRIFFLK